MIQKQIAASNKIQVKAPTPDAMAMVTVVIGGFDSSSTDSVGSEVSVWEKGKRILRALHLVIYSVVIILTLSC